MTEGKVPVGGSIRRYPWIPLLAGETFMVIPSPSSTHHDYRSNVESDYIPKIAFRRCGLSGRS